MPILIANFVVRSKFKVLIGDNMRNIMIVLLHQCKRETYSNACSACYKRIEKFNFLRLTLDNLEFGFTR